MFSMCCLFNTNKDHTCFIDHCFKNQNDESHYSSDKNPNCEVGCYPTTGVEEPDSIHEKEEARGGHSEFIFVLVSFVI